MRALLLFVAALALGGCVGAPDRSDTLDAIARDYVRLTLGIGERDDDYVDAYYGPPAWRAEAKAAPRTVAELQAAAASLIARAEALASSSPDPLVERRRFFLIAQLRAAATRLRMLAGERLSFAEEAEGLYGVAPEIEPLSTYDPLVERIDRLVPGTGNLVERVEAFQNRFIIPADRLDAVMRAAIGECRRRTLARVPLPPDERFTLEFVTGRSWSGYNWYKGNHESLIQVNTDLPVRLSRAVDLGCHEGYPGHHAYNVLLEQRLARGRGWIEFQVYPLYSPQSFIAEGSANYGIELAFPGEERLHFETATLYPLAGLPSQDAARYLALQEAMQALSSARFTIARDYLEGRISRPEAVALTQRYQLVSEQRAEQSVSFTDQYRAYVINYGLGRDMVARFIEAAGPDPATRWSRMVSLLTEPTLPSDLVAP